MTTSIIGIGYLGVMIAERLRALDPRSEILGTTTRAGRFPEIEAVGVRPVLADVLTGDGLDEVVRADRIVYCVGHRRGSEVSSRTLHVDGMSRFVHILARDGRGGRIVHVSTTSVYGQEDGSWVDE